MFHLSRRAALGGIVSSSVAAALPSAFAAPPGHRIVFSYFAGGNDETPGLRLAVSDDGLTFKALKDGQIFLTPEVGEKKLMRDPFLMQGHGKDRRWHLLWTTAWEGVTLGHATSTDLVHWSPQQAIPVMATVKGTRNVWAPEMTWDDRTKQYVIFWSSTVTGMFPETAGTSEDEYNHRLWYVATRNFQNFSKPSVLWDPGFSVIDATFLRHPELGLHIIVKDETYTPPKKHLRLAAARSALGPFGPLSRPFSPDWVEGPTSFVIGDWTYVYYDRYTAGKWGAVRSRDLVTWEDVSDQISFPAGARHGTMAKLPGHLAASLR